MWRRVKAWAYSIAVLSLLLWCVACAVQLWKDPGTATGRDGFWVVQLGAIFVLYGLVRFVRGIIRADRQANRIEEDQS